MGTEQVKYAYRWGYNDAMRERGSDPNTSCVNDAERGAYRAGYACGIEHRAALEVEAQRHGVAYWDGRGDFAA